MSNVTEQEVHQGALQRQFFGRAKLLVRAAEMVKQVQTKGGMMLVEGGPGEGKTVFMVNFMTYIGKLVCLFVYAGNYPLIHIHRVVSKSKSPLPNVLCFVSIKHIKQIPTLDLQEQKFLRLSVLLIQCDCLFKQGGF